MAFLPAAAAAAGSMLGGTAAAGTAAAGTAAAGTAAALGGTAAAAEAAAIAPEVMAMFMPAAVSGAEAAPVILPPFANAGSALVGEGLGAFAPEMAGLPAANASAIGAGTGIDFAKLAKAFQQANSAMKMMSPQNNSQTAPAMASPTPSQALPTNRGSQKKGNPYLQYLLTKIQNRRGI